MKNIILYSSIILFLHFHISNAQVEKEYDVNSFSRVLLKGAAQFHLIPSEKEKMVIRTEKNEVFDYIKTDRHGDLLTIDLTGKNKKVGKLFNEVEIDIYFKHINFIELNGAGSLTSEGVINADQLRAELSGTGKIVLEIQCREFNGFMHGTSVFEVTGTTKDSYIKLDGVGKFDASELASTKTDVMVNGLGGAIVNVKEYLIAELNGVGSIKYIGNPQTKEFEQNGLGSIKPYKD